MNFQNQADYLKQLNNEDILTGVFVPAPLHEETLKSQIMLRCGLLEPVYSEPEIMQAAIVQFFTREQWNITHLINIILAEYSPIENTDRYSEHTNNSSGSKNITGSGTETHSGKDERDIRHGGKDEHDTTNSGTDQRTIANSGTDTTSETHSGTDTTTNTVSAYNSSAYQPDSKSDFSHGESISGSTVHGLHTNDSLQHGLKVDDDLKYGHTIDDDLTHGHEISRGSTSAETTSGQDTYTEHTHGNIGVTTNQELIEQELQLLRHFDVYDWIAAKLENELFIQVY